MRAGVPQHLQSGRTHRDSQFHRVSGFRCRADFPCSFGTPVKHQFIRFAFGDGMLESFVEARGECLQCPGRKTSRIEHFDDSEKQQIESSVRGGRAPFSFA